MLFVFGVSNELVDDYLSCVLEVIELSFLNDQFFRIIEIVFVFEFEYIGFGKW